MQRLGGHAAKARLSTQLQPALIHAKDLHPPCRVCRAAHPGGAGGGLWEEGIRGPRALDAACRVPRHCVGALLG